MRSDLSKKKGKKKRKEETRISVLVMEKSPSSYGREIEGGVGIQPCNL